MKCFQSALLLLLILESGAARPFGFPSSLRMPAFAKRAFLDDTTKVLPLRGGATELTPPPQQQVEHVDEEAHMPPRISAADMALALRWTGEINRRLEWGTRSDVSATPGPLLTSLPVDASHSYPTVMRGGGGGVSSVVTEATAPLLTIFHTKSPRPTGNGANRWGPSLEAYIAHICHALDLTPDSSPELSLALIYLDRATSAETPRSGSSYGQLVPAVPFLQPRTVHRLVLTALLLATHTTQGWPLPVLMERVENLGIPPEQLSQMLQWMQDALGDPGYFVTLYSIQNWRHILTETARLRDLLPQEEEEDEGQQELATTDETSTTPSAERRQSASAAAETRNSATPSETEADDVAADNNSPFAGVEAA